eukprot:15693-Heterococcus_DN1.PRE.1
MSQLLQLPLNCAYANAALRRSPMLTIALLVVVACSAVKTDYLAVCTTAAYCKKALLCIVLSVNSS